MSYCRIRLQHGSGGRERMLMDGKTAANLEIISNLSRYEQAEWTGDLVMSQSFICVICMVQRKSER